MVELEGWQRAHKAVEEAFLRCNRGEIDAVLKGETALMLCYDLDRFSEDLDFDALSTRFDLSKLVKRFCDEYGYEWFDKKNTDTVARCTIHYGGEKPLKIEVSYRRNRIDAGETTTRNGILTYKIQALAMMKMNAYMGRDRIRDLFDVCFLINNHWDDFTPELQNMFRYTLAQKGLEQFDAVISEQSDNLIDPDKLAESFLLAYETIDPKTETPPAQSGRATSQSRSANEQVNRIGTPVETVPCNSVNANGRHIGFR